MKVDDYIKDLNTSIKLNIIVGTLSFLSFLVYFKEISIDDPYLEGTLYMARFCFILFIICVVKLIKRIKTRIFYTKVKRTDYTYNK